MRLFSFYWRSIKREEYDLQLRYINVVYMYFRTMFEWTSEDGETHHYRVGVEARLSDCTTTDKTTIPEPCMGDNDPSVTKSTLVQNVLGETLFSFMADVFKTTEEPKEIVEMNHCQLVHHFQYQKDLNDRLIFYIVGLLVISVISMILLRRILKLIFKRVSEKRTQIVDRHSVVTKEGPLTETGKASSNSILTEQIPLETKAIAREPYSGIPLSYQQLSSSNLRSEIKVKTLETAEFLRNTTDRLYAELDKLLLKNVNERSTAQLALSTPRLARRADRRGRVGSSPSLSVAEQQSTNDEPNLDTKEKIEAWKELKIFSREMDWVEPLCVSVDEAKLDRSAQRLLHYFHRVCPINCDKWEASVLLTNFALLLLNKEMKGMASKVGYKCVKLKPTGSNKIGHKVCKPNQYDVFMEIQPPEDLVPTSVIEQASTECIPPGRLLLGCKLKERSIHISSTSLSKVGKRIEVEGVSRQYCLSSKEMARSAEELTESCLQTLYTKHRSLVDRLPFQIKRAVVPNLVVSLDTKTLVGIGIPEIKINLIPVITMPFEGWYQPVSLYATPLMEVHEYKHRPETANTICPDFFWQVAFGDVNEMFHRSVNDRMKYAGIDSCHIMCLMILKALLTGGVKSSLLDRGEYQTLHISTVLNFLLLESQPEQWRFDQLVNRFSDCVHFLRDSFTNGRLPNFFINNPHIIEKMPFVRSLPLLMRKRQEDLLSDMRTEALEKCARFLEESLRDSGLAECVKVDYSHDMWEYEFFVFN